VAGSVRTYTVCDQKEITLADLDRSNAIQWYWASILASVIGVLSILPILFAGTHKYGAVSRVWQYTGIQSLFLPGIALLVISIVALRNAKVTTDSSNLGFFAIGMFCIFSLSYIATFSLVEIVLLFGVD